MMELLILTCDWCDTCVSSLPSSGHDLSCADCQEDKREHYQNWSVLCCVWQLYTMISTYIWAVLKGECWFRFNFLQRTAIHRNARIASAVLAMAFLSVCPSVRLSVTCRYCVKTTAIAWCSLHCQIAKCVEFCRNQKNSPGTTPSPWNKVRYRNENFNP